jgi:CDP-diacylglycerol pyrophosphatase
MMGARKVLPDQGIRMNRLVIGKTAALAAFAIVASSCAQIAAADPDALWKIVGGQCVPEARASGRPGQCTSENLA